MKQVVHMPGERLPRTVEIPTTGPAAGLVQIRTCRSLISSGTEMASVSLASSSLLGKAQKRPDLVRLVLDKARSEGIAGTINKVRHRLSQPLELGYSAAGIVTQVGEGVRGFAVGDRVAAAGTSYATHAEQITVPVNLCCRLPDGCDFDSGAFVSIGAVALHGIRTLSPQIGETVAVFGLGLVGQLTVQMLRAQGCRVIGIDPESTRRSKAKSSGAEILDPKDIALTFRMTDGKGCDGIIVTAASRSNDIIENAALLARDRAVIVIVGDVGLNVPRRVFYEKELQLRLARSYGPGRYDPLYEEQGIDYPIGHVRWTEQRNMSAFLAMIAHGRVDCSSLITHRFAVTESDKAYSQLRGNPSESLAVVFEYATAEPIAECARRIFKKNRRRSGRIGVGIIGGGQFAGGVLIPALRADRRTELTGIVTRRGIQAVAAAERFGFTWAGAEPTELFGDALTELVVIATPHRTHASLACAALKAGKAVFVEKPLVTTREELSELLTLSRVYGGRLQVGFNRRYAPALQRIREFFADRKEPMTVTYRAAAKPLESNDTGGVLDGGRLIGEVCHFMDAVQYVIGSWPRRVWAERIQSSGDDGFALMISFLDGSVAQISYTTAAATRTPKERLEAFADGNTAILDDYRRWSLMRDGRSITGKRHTQDKGHRAQITALLDAFSETGLVAGDFTAAALVTETSFSALDALATGTPVNINRTF